MSAFPPRERHHGETHDSALCVRRLRLSCCSIALAELTALFASANTKSDDEQAAASSSFEFNEKDGTLSIEWSGPIVPGVADYLRTALDRYATARSASRS